MFEVIRWRGGGDRGHGGKLGVGGGGGGKGCSFGFGGGAVVMEW